jgi:ADP-ribose pyrophosphatase YjhB (NUDIX family)
MTHPMYARQTVGDDTHIRVGVGVVVRDQQGRILLEKRSDCGMWGLPGGRIEVGESVTEASLREVWEETGLSVKIVRLLGVYSEPVGHIVTFPDNVVQLLDILLEAEVVSGELTCSRESERLEYFEVGHWPADIVPPASVPLQDVVEGRVGVIK